MKIGVLAAIVAFLPMPHLCSAQASELSNSAASSAPQTAASAEQSSGPEHAKKKRMFGMMPQYAVVEPGSAQPSALSAKQKFKLVMQNLDPYTFTFVAVEAGINQASNRPKEFGQGAEGYGKRYGANLADTWTGSLFVLGLYPSLLHQDPRYYRRGEGSFSHRAGYAISRVVITRQDSGGKSFNFSEVLGNLTSGSLAAAYYPESQRDASDVFQRGGIQVGFDAGFNLLKEFYPDIERKFFRKKKR